MCGIFGWHLKPGAPLNIAQREALAASLAAANTTRGGHSWGTYCAGREAGALLDAAIDRQVGPMAGVEGISSIGLCDLVMGHTRYATTGAKTAENSHPYVVGGITLAHNGMIYNHADLNRKYRRNCVVDSMHLAHHIAEGRDLTDCEGYGAIMYVRDNAPGAVHLSRMAGGQLAIHGLGSRSAPWGVVWSSDDRHLVAALDGAGLQHFPYEAPRTGRVYVTNENGTLYLLPAETLRHDLSEGGRSEREASYSKWLTSGARGSKPSPGRSLTKSEKRAERKARRRAHGKVGGTTARGTTARGGPLTALDTRFVKDPAPLTIEASEDPDGDEGEPDPMAGWTDEEINNWILAQEKRRTSDTN